MWCKRVADFIRRNSTVPGAVVIFALTYILMLAVNAGESGAAWAQAIGTVAAVMAAVWAVRQQEAGQAKKELFERFVIAKSLAEMARQAVHYTEKLGEISAPNIKADYEKEMVKARLGEFRRVDLLTLPDVRMVDQVMIIVANLELALHLSDQVENLLDKQAANEKLELLRTTHIVLRGAWLNLRILQGHIERSVHTTFLNR